MWKVILFEFIIVVIVSILWANAISKTNPNDYNDEPFP